MKYEIKENQIIIDDCRDKETFAYIDTTIYAFKGSIETVIWQSKYNRYITYDHKPSSCQGLNLIITLKEGNVYNEFILFHLTQQLNNVEHLEKCLTI